MSNSNMRHFHLTLGPVQSFVSQARRTRDFWAGSFLLSYLTAHAMKATRLCGEVIMPDILDDPLLARIENRKVAAPHIASLPNVFEASVPFDFDGAKVAQAIQDEWQRIADEVWTHDGLSALKVNKDLWDSQIGNFWEIVWVLTDSDILAPLSMRKNWHTHYPPEQLGDKCTMMGEWQELSGVAAPGTKAQKEFWKRLRDSIPNALDMREGERLCAISYVKRRFVHAWNHLRPDWKLPVGVPSTSYLATVHWIEQALEHGKPEAIKAFQVAAKAVSEYGEWKTSIRCIDAKAGEWGTGKLFASLDGTAFFRSAIENPKEYEDRAKADKLLAALLAVSKTLLPSGRTVGDPSPFYAI